MTKMIGLILFPPETANQTVSWLPPGQSSHTRYILSSNSSTCSKPTAVGEWLNELFKLISDMSGPMSTLGKTYANHIV